MMKGKGNKKKRIKIKNLILKSITAFALFFGICLCCGVEPQTDGQMVFVITGLVACWGWIIAFCYANGLM